MIWYLVALLAAGGLVALDQFIKEWVIVNLKPIGSMDFFRIGGTELIDLTYTENTGAAFSFMRESPLFLTVLVSVLLLGVTIYGLIDKDKRPFKSVCLVMIVSGGVGNLIDRFRYGFVVDYIELRFMNFAIFNFADILVTCGAVLLLINILFSESKSRRISKSVRRRRIHSEIAGRRYDDR
jgi:signal peptidase II